MVATIAATCPNCRTRAVHLLCTRDLNRCTTRDDFNYYRCRSCGLIFLYPVPGDLGRYYPDDYHGLPETLAQLEAGARLHETFKLELLQRFKSAGSVLEIGPGAGGFALLAKAAGYSVRVIELNERCCQFIRRTIGVDAIHSENELQTLREVEKADVIAMWQVLEHLATPFDLMDVASDRLNPGGVLIVAMPNPLSFQFRLLGRYWVHLDAPRHIALIPPQLLTSKAESLGLACELLTTRDAGSIAWNRFGWEYSIPNVSASPRRRDRLQRWGKTIGKLAALIDDREKWGSAYTAVYRKRGL